LVYIFPFWYVVPRKIWQPWSVNLTILIKYGRRFLKIF
jgi:hypothetical protein